MAAAGKKIELRTFTEVSYKEIEPNPLNPRRIFDKLRLDVLEESIRANKILVPLTAYRDSSSKKLYILDGERRWRCALRIELGEVSVQLRSLPQDLKIPSALTDTLVYDDDTKVLSHRAPIHEARRTELLSLSTSNEWRKAVQELCELSKKRPQSRVRIPVNVVDPPTPAANMLYMFHVHNLREQWELMPTALSLRILMDELKVTDDAKLAELTELSEPNVKRCKILLSFPIKYQQMMLEPDPARRLKANLFIEMDPVLNLYEELSSRTRQRKTRNQLTDFFIEKYRRSLIPSVIHFRKILQARDLLRGTARWKEVVAAMKQFVADPESKIKTLFDPLIAEERQVNDAAALCREFVATLRKLKLQHATKRTALLAALKQVKDETTKLLESLSGED
jgi:ParB-like chromosome segregation protein Spo0J